MYFFVIILAFYKFLQFLKFLQPVTIFMCNV